jgi:hypothetical protein
MSPIGAADPRWQQLRTHSHQTWLYGEPRAKPVRQILIVEVCLVSFGGVEQLPGAPRIEHLLPLPRVQVPPIGQDGDIVKGHGYGIQTRPDHGIADGRLEPGIPASRICAT